MADVLAANLEEGAEVAYSKVGRRPLCLLLLVLCGVVALFAVGPLTVVIKEKSREAKYLVKGHARVSSLPQQWPPPPPSSEAALSTASPPPAASLSPPPASLPPPAVLSTSLSTTQTPAPVCGDGRCDPGESIASCSDCPGVTTPAVCGEEPHSDPQGNAVVDGRGHHVQTAGQCCDACAAHAAKNPKRPCNSWVFCPQPHCWSADNGNTHLFGECWLKWQTDPSHPLYGQRGEYTERYRRANRDKHLNGAYPAESNPEWVGAFKAWAASPLSSPSASGRPSFGIVAGSRRNLTVPSHVSWMGGVMGAKVDTLVRWSTDADGTMRSSDGEVIVDYRPWESREQNLKRGVKPEQMRF